MKEWMQELHLVKNLSEIGVTKEVIPEISKNVFMIGNGYKKLSKDDILYVLNSS